MVVRTALLHDICQLGQALNFFKHECLHLPKADVNWSQGLLHLVLLFHFQDSRLQSWGYSLRCKLQSMGLTPLQYSYPFAVYIKVAVDWRCGSSVGHYEYRQPSTMMMYIGSTGVSVTLREANRMSVLRKLEGGREAQAELAIRYWHQNSCFQQSTLIKIGSCQRYRAAWILEHLLISQWQPKLNYPYAQSSVSEADCIRQRLASFTRFGLRLWRKLRKRLFHSVQLFECAVQRRQAWEFLYDL